MTHGRSCNQCIGTNINAIARNGVWSRNRICRLSRYSHRNLAFFLILSCFSLISCSAGGPIQKSKEDFNGSWSVKWCDRTNPKLDCGGFDITLVQDGERICGDFGGALVNLRQIDEGTIVGTSIGNTAILAVESMRSQSIVLVRATLQGDSLHWRAIDEIKRGGNDIDVIASDDVLIRNTKTGQAQKKLIVR